MRWYLPLLAVLGCLPVASPSLLTPDSVVQTAPARSGGRESPNEGRIRRPESSDGASCERIIPEVEKSGKEIRVYDTIHEHHGDLCNRHLATIEILAEELRPPDRVVLKWTVGQRHAYFVSEHGMKENWPYEKRKADIHVLVHDGDDFIVKLRYIKTYTVKWIDDELLYVSNWPGRIYQVVQVIDVSKPEVVFSKCRQHVQINHGIERPPSGH